MICFIIETPLAKNDISSRILDFLYHINEIFLLHLIKFVIVINMFNFKSVLSFWFWWLEWAGQNQNFSVLDFFFHLWMREIFIENDTLDEFRIFNSSTILGDDFNQIEVDIFSFEVGNS